MNLSATEQDIRAAYRLILNREPDENGLRHYKQMLADSMVTPTEIARIFLASAEYMSLLSSQEAFATVDFEGYKMIVPKNDGAIGKWIIKDSMWERHITEKMKKLLGPGMTFVDVGANIGYYTAMAAAITGSDGLVIAIEPLERNVQSIYKTCVANKFSNVIVYQCGASDIHATVPVDTGAGTSNGSLRSESPSADALSLTQTCKLDIILANLNRIDIIKLDIEGFESRAWLGLAKTLERCRPDIIVEYHPKCLNDNGRSDPLEFLEKVFEYGKEVYVVNDDGSETSYHSPAAVHSFWKKRDEDRNEDNGSHLDLFVNAGRRVHH